NACPVYKNVGGHSYGTTYQGPIGSVITPHLRDLGEYKHLSFASSLCGNCTSVCPVHIELHRHLLENRRNAVRAGFSGWLERALFRAWAGVMQSPGAYRLAALLARLGQQLLLLSGARGSVLDPLRRWTMTRALPKVAPLT